MTPICPQELRRLYHQRRVLPFIGAGASMAVNWMQGEQERRGPSWSELVDVAARMLDFAEPALIQSRGTNLQILEYFRIKFGNFSRLTNWLSREMNPPDESLARSELHTALSRLSECQIFYTTNFDDFLERSFRLNGRETVVTTAEIDISFDRSLTEVIKFHGDLNSPDQMVVSERDFYKRMSLQEPMDLKLRSDLLGRTILFIGYSFGDPNVNYLFHVVNTMLASLPDSTAGRRAYIILPDPSDFERRLFDARDIEVIPIDSLDRVGGIVQTLAQMADE